MEHELIIFNKDIQVVGLHALLYLENSKNYYFTGERHDFWELLYVDSGEVLVVADSAKYTLSQGDVIFYKPNEFHAVFSSRKTPHNVLVVNFTADGNTMNFFENKIFLANKEQKKLLSSLLCEACSGLGYVPNNVLHVGNLRKSNLMFGAPQLIVNYLEQFLILLMRDNQNNGQNNRSLRAKYDSGDTLVTSVVEYLSDNRYAKITLSDICKNFYLSKSYLCKLFKDVTDQTIMDYYRNMKIKEAKFLIRKEALNYTQIAEKLGYTSIHHFTRVFKASTGMSPSNYQKSIK